jgi:streptogramin lyase
MHTVCASACLTVRAFRILSALAATACAALLFAAEPRTITTVAGSGRGESGPAEGSADAVNINQPFGLEFGPDGALYICGVGHHRIFRFDMKAGKVTNFAGTGKKGAGGDGGPATAAALAEPYELRFDKAGNLYFVEMVGAVVRKVDARTGVITTVAGTGKVGFAGDGGPAVKAEFRQPHSIALDDAGNLYIADIGNHRIRRVDAGTGVIDTIAGNGEKKLPEDGAVATGKPMVGPRALFIAGGTLWIALREGHSVWKMDLAGRKLTHVAGTGKVGHADGPGKTATFNGPKGIAVGPDGAVFVVDTENQVIRRIDPKTFAVTTTAGAGIKARGFGGDGGPATGPGCKMDRPHGICVGADGSLYIGDSNNHRVRKVGP